MTVVDDNRTNRRRHLRDHFSMGVIAEFCKATTTISYLRYEIRRRKRQRWWSGSCYTNGSIVDSYRHHDVSNNNAISMMLTISVKNMFLILLCISHSKMCSLCHCIPLQQNPVMGQHSYQRTIIKSNKRIMYYAPYNDSQYFDNIQRYLTKDSIIILRGGVREVRTNESDNNVPPVTLSKTATTIDVTSDDALDSYIEHLLAELENEGEDENEDIVVNATKISNNHNDIQATTISTVSTTEITKMSRATEFPINDTKTSNLLGSQNLHNMTNRSVKKKNLSSKENNNKKRKKKKRKNKKVESSFPSNENVATTASHQSQKQQQNTISNEVTSSRNLPFVEKSSTSPSNESRLYVPPPNATYRFLLRSGYIGRIIVLGMIALTEFIKLYIPQLFAILETLWKRYFPPPSMPSSFRSSSTTTTDPTSSTGSLSSHRVMAGQSKKQRQSMTRQADEYAMKQLQRLGNRIHHTKYRFISTSFMKRHGLGDYALTKQQQQQSDDNDDRSITTKLLDEQQTQHQPSKATTTTKSSTLDGSSLFEKIVPFVATTSSKKKKYDKDDDDTTIQKDWVIQAMTRTPPLREERFRRLDWSKTNKAILQLMVGHNLYETKKEKGSMMPSSYDDTTEPSSSSLSSLSDGNNLVGRLRAVSGTALSRSLLGAYPGDAVPPSEAASANGIIPLAYKYGYGEWSDDDDDDDEPEDDHDDEDDDMFALYPNNNDDDDDNHFGSGFYNDDDQNDDRNYRPVKKETPKLPTLKRRIVKKKKAQRKGGVMSSSSTSRSIVKTVSKGGSGTTSNLQRDQQRDDSEIRKQRGDSNTNRQQRKSGFYVNAEMGTNHPQSGIRLGYHIGNLEVGINLGGGSANSSSSRNSRSRRHRSFHRSSVKNANNNNNNNTPTSEHAPNIKSASTNILYPPRSTFDQLQDRMKRSNTDHSRRSSPPQIRKGWNHRVVTTNKEHSNDD